MDAVVVTRPRPAVAVVTMTRPERLNAMNRDLIEGLHGAFDELEHDEECRVIILTGAGRGFCAGVDITGYGPPPASDRLEPARRTMSVQKRIAALIPKMRSLPQPVIAAVNGAAAGGGLALVLGSDVRLAARSATFNVAFIRIGLSACDIGTSWLLPRLVGVARAQELMLDRSDLPGRGGGADRARHAPLRRRRTARRRPCQGRRDLHERAVGVALTKEAMWSALEIPGLQAAIDVENRQQVLLTTVPDHLEAMQAFVEKRPPEYGRR